MVSSSRQKHDDPPNCYGPWEGSGPDYDGDLADPGHYPYTRGIHPEMYRRRFWTMRQYAGYSSAADSNRRYHYLLSRGTKGLSVAFDLPTQLGLDSDHEEAIGEVGRAGVPIDSLKDMGRLFEGIPLQDISTSMTINATAATLLAFYLVTARRQGAEWPQLRGTIQNDILKEYIARGTYIYPPKSSLRLITDIFAFARNHLPRWNTISISGYHIREAGSTAAQEIGFTLANAECYIEAALAAGLDIDYFAPQLSFFFNAHSNLLEEIAKFRAARRIWARSLKERFQASNPRSLRLRFHAQTAGSTLTAQQPDNNVVRVAYQALAAILGGAQSLHTNSRDEALALPTQEAALLALRTQQILAHESGIATTADPLGGSWCIEALTDRLEEEAEDYLSRIRSMGGMLRAIETGFVQSEIQDSAFRQQQAVESGEKIVVGVNRFSQPEETVLPTLRIDGEVERRQVERLRSFRRKRDGGKVERALDQTRKVAAGTDNLMPALVAAVEAKATVGEIAQALGDVFGYYHESAFF